MRRLVVLTLTLAFGLSLALIVGERMSREAMAVVIGVAVGVATSVPTSLLLFALLRRERHPEPPLPPTQSAPPVMLIDPMAQARAYGYELTRRPEPPPTLLADGGRRTFHVIGEEWREDD
jgi:hypothetical protein